MPPESTKKIVAKAAPFYSPEITLAAYTFSWIDHEQLKKGNGKNDNGLSDNLKSIMNNVALVSALCLTIWIGILFQDYSGRVSVNGDSVELWKVNTLVTILWLGTVLQATSMVNAVFVSMLVDACSTPIEVAEFVSRVPIVTRMPILQFYIAILVGILGMLFYFFTFFGMRMLYFMSGVCFVIAIVLNAIFYHRNVAALRATLETTSANGCRVLDKAQIAVMLDAYVAQVGFEHMDPGAFLDFLAAVDGGLLELAFVTKRRANDTFERFLDKRMSAEGYPELSEKDGGGKHF